jgi:hypothetical protein
MADIKFPCPTCQQSIVCDELWCGQEIQCPSCKAQLVVPRQEAAEQPSLVPKPPTAGASKLSIGRHEKPPGPPPSGQRFVPGAMKPMAKPAKKKADVMKYVKVVVALAVLGGAGYFGYDWWTKRQAKKEAEAAAAAKAVEDAAKAQREASAPSKPLPVIPPSWTLDVEASKIPEGQANGSVAGTNFVVDSASITRSGTAQVLNLKQGAASPDREILIYLHLAAGETLTNHSWSVSQEMKGSAVPQVLKRWKTAPTAAMQQKFFSTGYAMKLELGQSADGNIPGKIFLALPDTEQSVVAGLFKIQPPSSEPVAAQPMIQAPAGAPGGSAVDRAAFDKRYGIRKR